ncbi:MAG TPA: hypothetical protein PKE26_02205 [Kiritimatiellia bacterium]|nr:hypothetical protein [Kiritimatiellia bacterium]HMO97901.1 hypothetical protein [Kiritimatiellia bacterium]
MQHVNKERAATWATVVLTALAVLVVARAAWITLQAPAVGNQPDGWSGTQEFEAEPETISAESWALFRARSGVPTDRMAGERFRLAGTFLVMGADPDNPDGRRRAILDDIQANRQHIVSVGQQIEDHEIVSIDQDRLLLRHNGEERTLTLSFKDGPKTPKPQPEEEGDPSIFDDPEEVVLESNRFGQRIGETRWVIQRQALVDYYYELLDQPERIAAIYMSMKPDYNPDGDIRGYQLDFEGEKEFFESVGLREGDKIRRVNSMNMTSQARAEYFIGEFMQERLGAVVIDVERDGEIEKLIYLLR